MNIEPLESRIAPATFTVTSNAPFGPGTLAEALSLAFSSMGTDTINFNLPTMQTTITLDTMSSTFLVDSPVIIDGRSQTGYVDSPLITIERGMSSATDGLLFDSGSDGSEVHGLTIRNFADAAIEVQSHGVIISGCTLVSNQSGIEVSGSNVTIGGAGASGRNVISGNAGNGISASSAIGLTVKNSYIGVDRSGMNAAGNGGGGIHIDEGFNFTIGGEDNGGSDKNVIAGNGGSAISTEETGGTVRIRNNYIGIFADRTFGAASKNSFGNLAPAISVQGPAVFIIGNEGMTNSPNYISNNAGTAISIATESLQGTGTAIIAGNFIGAIPGGMSLIPASNAGGIVADGPAIHVSSNTIFDSTRPAISTGPFGSINARTNSLYGFTTPIIDVYGDGRTANDSDQSDSAQNFPILSGAYLDGMGDYHVIGSIHSRPNSELVVTIYGNTSGDYNPVTLFSIFTDASGNASFDQIVPSLANHDFVAATATDVIGETTSEMSDIAPVAPAILFSSTGTISANEGNAGATLVSFEVSITSAPSQPVSVQLSTAPSSTATPGADFSFSPSTLNFGPTTTTQMVTVAITGETAVEPTEFINFILSNLNGDAVLIGSTKSIQITNDDTSLKVAPDRKSATWKDVDGDLVTLKSTKTVLDAADFTFEAQGLLGGEVLRTLNLTADGAAAKGAGLALTAKFDKVNNLGDGSVHVGHINAAGVDLGTVVLPGNLERISVGDTTLTDGSIKSLTTGSLGLLGSNKVTDGGDYASNFAGKVGALIVKGDIRGAQLEATGSFGAISVLGNFATAGTTPWARITASGDITSLKIGGSMLAQTGSRLLVIAEGKLGSVTVGRSLDGNGGFVRLFGNTSIGKVSVGGDMESTVILAGGKARPANALAALAIASVAVKGNVADSSIVAGLDSGGHGNPDAQIGALSVGGAWSRSWVAAGIDIVNDITTGDADDAVVVPTGPFTDNPAIVSKIASITIKGHIYGTAAAGDTFGFVAQSFGKFIRGTTAYTLRPNPIPSAQPLDVFNVSITGDVFVREVI